MRLRKTWVQERPRSLRNLDRAIASCEATASAATAVEPARADRGAGKFFHRLETEPECDPVDAEKAVLIAA
jgi:hypothetical protein